MGSGPPAQPYKNMLKTSGLTYFMNECSPWVASRPLKQESREHGHRSLSRHPFRRSGHAFLGCGKPVLEHIQPLCKFLFRQIFSMVCAKN